MSTHEVNLGASGPPETVLDNEPDDALDRLSVALDTDSADRRAAVAAVVADHPTMLAGWAYLGDLASNHIDAYAAYRVGYHRGLDRLRQSGWRGTGFVRWEHESNRGFLRSVAGLGRMAATIGEVDEAERCELFCRQLDPTWPPPDLT
ncbi:MAG: DUF3151 family protein [Acidobacteria bacterium]|nr:DUF3151 family protein [Acidobacteriota bacterium]